MGWGQFREKKPHLVNLKITCTEKKKGCLGVRSLSLFNKEALLCKWRSVINRKFGEVEGGWSTCDLRGEFGTNIWK